MMKQGSILDKIGGGFRRAFALKPADKTVYARNAYRITSALEKMARKRGYNMDENIFDGNRLVWFAFIGALYENLMLNCKAWQAKDAEDALDDFSDIATTLYIMGMDKIPGQEVNEDETQI